MNLVNVTQQKQLLYFNQREDSISIYENDHYRWLLFDDVTQSLMLKRKPERLMLPHQMFLMLPLLFFRPKKVCEFGLGGGNLSRFLKTLAPTIQINSIEKNAQVIDCFKNYFNPQQQSFNLINDDAKNALFNKQLRFADWYIYDIYQHNNEATNAQLLKSKLLAKAITEDSWLSLNLPDPTEPELNYLIEQLHGVFTDHKMVLFRVPRYLNIVIHFVPKKLFIANKLSISTESYLPNYQCIKGFNYWSTLNIPVEK